MWRQREYIRPWLGLRFGVEINVTSNPLLAYTVQTEQLFSSYHQLHTHTQLSPARSRTISFMVAQSLWNVILPGKLAIISQRLQLSQLYSIGKRVKSRGGIEGPRNWGNEFMSSSKERAVGSAVREAGRKVGSRRKRNRCRILSLVACQ